MTVVRERDPYWDNAKAILVTLVVVGHAIQPAAAHEQVGADVLYRWIYLFHMPAFVLVGGYLSASLTRRRAGLLAVGLVVPYLIFQVAQAVERAVIDGEQPDLTRLLVPRWTLWFLVAMVLWRLSAPLWLALRPTVAVVGAVALAVVAGLGSGVGHALALDDTLGYLPFFVGGLLLRERGWRPPATTSARWLAAGALVLAPVVIALTRDSYSRSVHQLGFAATATDDGNLSASALRLLLLGAGAVLTLAVLVLVPRGGHAWTSVGRWSLYVYLLHALVLIPFREGERLGQVGALGVVVVVVLSVALTLVLASRPARVLTWWAVEPTWTGRLLVRPSEGPEPR
ncbi:fucose 4-O-acetylase-like acetyltransferase [Cellulomonas sp. PhB150]|nr:fucose 4-O-acetylase-like acetyltransferase [Cellulomonas sp. PhB150]